MRRLPKLNPPLTKAEKQAFLQRGITSRDVEQAQLELDRRTMRSTEKMRALFDRWCHQ